MQKHGIVEPAASPWASNIVLVGQRMSAGTKRNPWKRDVTFNRSTVCNGRCGCCVVTAEVSKSGDIGRQRP